MRKHPIAIALVVFILGAFSLLAMDLRYETKIVRTGPHSQKLVRYDRWTDEVCLPSESQASSDSELPPCDTE